jgi:glyoxylase-like metal-dependent hydrolase (beta-lactamase superfamily II)
MKRKLAAIMGGLCLVAASGLTATTASAQVCSAWLVENSRFMNVPFGMFHPDRSYVQGSTNPRNNVNTVDLPVNVGVIKCGNEVILFDNGWNATDYHKATGTDHWAPLSQQIAQLGIKAADVSKIIVGHGHWDHAGSMDEFPNAKLYIQKEELRGIEWALNYPGHERIRAMNTSPGGCSRTPACGYPPKTVDQIYSKVLRGMAVIVDGDMDVMPGVKIHAAHRAHTAGSQLLEVNTSVGKLMFGSDAYSSWEAIRDWEVANIQQTDSVQQFLAYEKCYKVTGGFANCVAAHEPLSYSDKYPLTKNSWVGINGGRLAEIALAPGEASRKK